VVATASLRLFTGATFSNGSPSILTPTSHHAISIETGFPSLLKYFPDHVPNAAAPDTKAAKMNDVLMVFY
jgi:hypothetical protein